MSTTNIVRSQKITTECYKWQAQNFDTIPLKMFQDVFGESLYCMTGDYNSISECGETLEDLTFPLAVAEFDSDDENLDHFYNDYSLYTAHGWLWHVSDSYLSEWINGNRELVYNIGFRIYRCSYFDNLLLGTDVCGMSLFYQLWNPLYKYFFDWLEYKKNVFTKIYEKSKLD